MVRIAISISLMFGVFLAETHPEDSPALHRWIFDDQHVQGQHVVSVAGGFDGEVLGEAKLIGGPGSIQLDGLANHIAWPIEGNDVRLPTRDCSFAAWVAIDRVQEWGAIVGAIQDNGDYERGWLLGYRDATFCLAIASAGKQHLTYLTAEEDFVRGLWYFVVGTYDGSTMRLFVDGELVASSAEQSGDILYPPKTWLEIGAYHDDDELYPMAGRLAEIGIYNRAISASDVQEQFETTKHRFPNAEAIVEEVAAWPTYMRDNGRSGVTTEKVALPLFKSWEYRTRLAPAPAWPPPANQDFWHDQYALPARVTFDRAFHVVSDGTRVYFGSSSEDQVVAVSLATGEPLWSFFAEGPVRLAPTIADGNVYFGADDGCVYCLNAHDGELVWRYHVSESDRRIAGNGRIVSLLPIRTGIMIESGQARFAAGLFPLQGTYQYLLDMHTGSELAKGKLAFSPQGYTQRRGGSMMVAQGRAPITRLAATSRGVKIKVEKAGNPLDEFPLALIRAGNVRFAGGDGKVAAFDDHDQKVWTTEVAGAAYSLAVAGNSLLVSTDQGFLYRFTSDAPTKSKLWDLRNGDPITEDAPVSAEASAIVQHTDSDLGYCLLIGDRLDGIAVELARRTRLKMLCAVSTESEATAARRRVNATGVYGQVTVQHVSQQRLPYASGLFNVVVCQGNSESPPATTADEVYRLLRPGQGTAVLLGASENGDTSRLDEWAASIDREEVELRTDGPIRLIVRRKPLVNVGQWTHIYAGIGNTSCSEDQLVGGDLALQWFGEPGPQQMLDRHHRTVPPLYIEGRMFVPGNDRVYGVDAYNGTVLWNVEVANSRRVAAMRDAGSMAASKEYLYVAAGDRCYGLASQTGAFELNLPVPQLSDGKPRDWGYVAYVGDQLFGSATKPDASRDHHSREQINETYFDFVPLVTSDAIFSMNRHTGERLWQYEPSAGAIVNATMTIGGGRIYFIESTNPATLKEPSGRSKLEVLLHGQSNLVALDLITGELLWRAAFDFSEIQHQLFLCYSQEKLVAVGTKNKQDGVKQFVWYDLHGFDAAGGGHVWSTTQNQRWESNGDHGEQDHHPTIVGDTIYQQPYAYNLHTGKRNEDWQFARGGHGCGALSASASTVFFRAANPTMCDLATGKNSKVTQVSRPGCWINMIPAGGLLMIPEASSGCTCNFPIQASMVFAPAVGF
ncbi:MAG: PQQ-binding-like beta-propeller repeat protein [Planctomycetota bacterium]|nr:PQQ-binding-like beta-propeller repeat protein [Planctomycetota bacterium]